MPTRYSVDVVVQHYGSGFGSSRHRLRKKNHWKICDFSKNGWCAHFVWIWKLKLTCPSVTWAILDFSHCFFRQSISYCRNWIVIMLAPLLWPMVQEPSRLLMSTAGNAAQTCESTKCIDEPKHLARCSGHRRCDVPVHEHTNRASKYYSTKFEMQNRLIRFEATPPSFGCGRICLCMSHRSTHTPSILHRGQFNYATTNIKALGSQIRFRCYSWNFNARIMLHASCSIANVSLSAMSCLHYGPQNALLQTMKLIIKYVSAEETDQYIHIPIWPGGDTFCVVCAHTHGKCSAAHSTSGRA